MQVVYCHFCGEKIVCNGSLTPSTCPMLEGCIIHPKAYTFPQNKEHALTYNKNGREHILTNLLPFVDIDSGKVYCRCLECSKSNRSYSQMFMIHCWENLKHQIITNPSER